MLAATAVAVTLAGCVPMRWISADPASLTLLKDSPVNCLLLEEPQWALAPAVRERGLLALAVVRSAEQARRVPARFDALVTEGGRLAGPAGLPVVALAARRDLHLEEKGVAGTTQGVWPGIEVEHSGPKTTEAAPTGSAWIHTNTGFLRYVHAVRSGTFWMANTPPPGTEWDGTRYAVAIADAATVGARWVVSLDDSFRKRLLAGEEKAAADWTKIQQHLRFYENNTAWKSMQPFAELALVQDLQAGAYVTGNLLDMLAVLNTPVRAMQSRELTETKLDGTKVTVAIHPQSYTEDQRSLIEKFALKGGKVVTGEKGFSMPEPADGQFTFTKEDYKQLEKIWPELHLAVQRKNFGVRMFNVSGTLSYLMRNADGSKAVLHLVNYTGYPVESVTAFVQGKYKSAKLLTPEGEPRKLEIYDTPEGTGIEIDQMNTAAAVVLE
ncbi:MAG: hypothetical protein JNK87_30890 [Bryobacterales bacterium]|nr:hypothetical protein [Bryobacterales bacterium]